MERMWMVRAKGGTLYDLFRERSAVAIGWTELAAKAKPGMTRQQLIELYRKADPLAKPGTAISGASQVWRFINEVAVGDWVVTLWTLDNLVRALVEHYDATDTETKRLLPLKRMYLPA